MKTILFYLLAVIVISGIFYGYYYLALRNKKFHYYNRFYLLVATLLSFIIPLFNIPVYFSEKKTQSSFVFKSLSVISGSGHEENVNVKIVSVSANWFTVQHILYLVYLLFALLFLARIILSLIKIRHIIQQNSGEKIGEIHFINTEEPGTPFSFFNWLFWNRKIELRSEKGEQIFRHELFHITQKHSLDIIFMELINIVFWINPIFHIIKRELKAIHEFLADRHAVKENNKWQYAELLLMQALQTKHSLVNPFFHNQIKRRIAMITQSQQPGPQYIRKLMLLPLGMIALFLFAFSYKNKKETGPVNRPDKPFVVIVDAGHGGTDAGAKAPDGTLEKELTLAIAKKIKALNDEKNIKIILTRETDMNTGLHERVDLATKENADLFISLHINSASSTPSFEREESQKGIVAFISQKNKRFEPENKILGTIILNYFSQIYPTKMEILRRNVGIYILDYAPCPSVIIECGYISNHGDLAYMKNTNNQEEIAKTILKSIDQYIMQSQADDWKERMKTVSDTIGFLERIAKDKKQGEKLHGWSNKKTGNQLVFVADSFVFRNNPNYKSPNLDNTLYIVDGKTVTHDFLNNNIIIAKLMTVYPPGDEEATAKYGAIAVNGVIEFNNAYTESNSAEKEPSYDTIPIKDQKNRIIKYEVQNKSGDIVFDKVEVEAKFPGGNQKWRQFLERNLDVSRPMNNKAPDGTYTVIVQFIVNTDGSIADVKTLTKHGYGMEEEASRVISKGPKWDPAIQNGHKVRAYRKQPITFYITSGSKEEKARESIIKENTKAPDTNKLNEVVIVGFSNNKIPEIKLEDLKKISPHELMNLNDDITITSYTLSIDDAGDAIHESFNMGDRFSTSTRLLIENATKGRTLIVEKIRGIKDGKETKFPAVVYKVI